MKFIIALCLFGLAVAAPDSGELSQVVGYQGLGSSVSIHRGVGSYRRQEASEEQYRPTKVRYVSAPRVEYERPRYQTVQYVEPEPVVYREPEPQTIVYRQPKPKRVYYKPAPVVYERPKVVYKPRPVVYEQPKPVVYRQPKVYKQPKYSAESYEDSDAKYAFAYEVRDDDTYNYQTRQEQRDGNKLDGVYTVMDPDGYLRTVKYYDHGYGFVAQVTRELKGPGYGNHQQSSGSGEK